MNCKNTVYWYIVPYFDYLSHYVKGVCFSTAKVIEEIYEIIQSGIP